MAGGRFFSAPNTATNFLTWGAMKFGMPTKKFTKAEKNEYYKTSKAINGGKPQGKYFHTKDRPN